MRGFSTIVDTLTSTDVKIRRQIKYWAATVAIYSMCIVLLLLEVRLGHCAFRPALWLTVFGYAGMLLSYVLIRASKRLYLLPSQLAVCQAIFAILYIVAAYAIVGQARGATLIILLVVLMFCAFALEPEKSRAVSLFAIILLGITMAWMINVDPMHFPILQEAVHFALATIMLAVAALLIGQLSQMRSRLKIQKAELAEALERIQTLATRDELTSLANRRHMNEILAAEERRHSTEGRPVCIALLDIDWFKQINDTHGHDAGDEVLRTFAQQAQSVLRSTDILARWGGEEFLLLLPDTELQAALRVLERVKEQVTALRFPAIAVDLRVSFSAGLVALQPAESIAAGIRHADHAMYRAKSQGRNRIITAQ